MTIGSSIYSHLLLHIKLVSISCFDHSTECLGQVDQVVQIDHADQACQANAVLSNSHLVHVSIVLVNSFGFGSGSQISNSFTHTASVVVAMILITRSTHFFTHIYSHYNLGYNYLNVHTQKVLVDL